MVSAVLEVLTCSNQEYPWQGQETKYGTSKRRSTVLLGLSHAKIESPIANLMQCLSPAEIWKCHLASFSIINCRARCTTLYNVPPQSAAAAIAKVPACWRMELCNPFSLWSAKLVHQLVTEDFPASDSLPTNVGYFLSGMQMLDSNYAYVTLYNCLFFLYCFFLSLRENKNITLNLTRNQVFPTLS